MKRARTATQSRGLFRADWRGLAAALARSRACRRQPPGGKGRVTETRGGTDVWPQPVSKAPPPTPPLIGESGGLL